MLNKSEPVSYACAVKLLGNWCSRTAVFVFSRTFQPLCKKEKEAKTKTKKTKKKKTGEKAPRIGVPVGFFLIRVG